MFPILLSGLSATVASNPAREKRQREERQRGDRHHHSTSLRLKSSSRLPSRRHYRCCPPGTGINLHLDTPFPEVKATGSGGQKQSAAEYSCIAQHGLRVYNLEHEYSRKGWLVSVASTCRVAAASPNVALALSPEIRRLDAANPLRLLLVPARLHAMPAQRQTRSRAARRQRRPSQSRESESRLT